MELTRTIPLGTNTSSKVEHNVNLYVSFDMDSGVLRTWCCRDNGRQCGHNQILTTGFMPMRHLNRRDLGHIHRIMYMWNQNDRRNGLQEQMNLAYSLRGVSHLGKVMRGSDMFVYGGHEWGSVPLFEEVPEEVLRFLFSLPGSGNTLDDIMIYLDKRVQGVDLDDLIKFLPA